MKQAKFKQTEIGEIPEDWEIAKLTEIGEMGRGKSKHRPRDDNKLYGGNYPFIQTAEVKNANSKIYSYRQTYNEIGLKQSKLWPKGTICITIAANVAESSVLTFPACFPDSIIGIIPDNSKYDTEFINYSLEYISNNLANKAIGSVQKNLNLYTLKNTSIPAPILKEQKEIANILSSLDEKIEANRKMNKTLEEIGKAIFKHWFVDFEFPNENGKPYKSSGGEMVDSELGEIPKRWEAGKLDEAVNIFDSERIPISSREREKRKGKYPYYGASGIFDHIDDYIFEGKYVLVGEDGTVKTDDDRPFTQYVWGKFWVNNHAHILQGKGKYSTEYIKLFLDSINITPHITGAVQPKLNQTNMKSIDIVKPDNKIIERFDNVIQSLFTLIRNNEMEVSNLEKIRDLLMPRLMSGRIRVHE